MIKKLLLTTMLIGLMTGFLFSDEFYISFDGPYLKSWPAQAPAEFVNSAGTRNIYCSFTAEWENSGKIGTDGYCF
ncbi:MAG: hypothetical protein JXJ04_14605, partial [Spirochaetales bacterium]|nr:hypothetical protein [Spirochaetales bacterium]